MFSTLPIFRERGEALPCGTSFNRLGGDSEQPWGHLNVTRSRLLKVDDELELG
jgi:hypothetical protein